MAFMTRILSFSRLAGRLFLLGFLVSLTGCDLTGVRVVRVSGTVTRGGKPVPNLFLNFRPATGRPSWGITDEHGHYVLHFDKSRDGAVPGHHTVWATFKPCDPREDRVMEQGELKQPDHLPEIIAKYGNPRTTTLQFEINTDGQVINLPLD
jgi:hypothetical protein